MFSTFLDPANEERIPAEELGSAWEFVRDAGGMRALEGMLQFLWADPRCRLNYYAVSPEYDLDL